MARTEQRVTGIGGSALFGAWGLYSTLHSVADLPNDASGLEKLMADPPIYLPWLAFAVCVAVLIWSFWPHKPADPAQDSHSQNSTGTQSPNLRDNYGTIQYGPPSSSPNPTPFQLPPVDALERALGTVPPRPPMEISRNAMRELDGLPRLEGDFKLSQLGNMLLAQRRHRIGHGVTVQDLIREVNLEISDKIGQHTLLIWARQGRHRREPISQFTLKTAVFDFQNDCFNYLPQDVVHRVTLGDVLLNREEVDRVWPKPTAQPKPPGSFGGPPAAPSPFLGESLRRLIDLGQKAKDDDRS